METIGKTWKSEMSEMRKKVVSHGINIFLGPVILYTLVRRNSTFHEDCLSIPCMTPIPWLKLPLCLQINSVPPAGSAIVVPRWKHDETPRTSRASLRTGKSSPHTGDSCSLEAMITGDTRDTTGNTRSVSGVASH